MNRSPQYLLFTALALGAFSLTPSSAGAIVVPMELTGVVLIDGVSTSFSVQGSGAGNKVFDETLTFPEGAGTPGPGVDAVVLDISGNADPYLNVTFGAWDTGDATSFGLVVIMPLVPLLGPPVDFSTSLNVNLSDGGQDGVSITVYSISYSSPDGSGSFSNTNLTAFSLDSFLLSDLGTAISGSGGPTPFSDSGIFSGGTTPMTT